MAFIQEATTSATKTLLEMMECEGEFDMGQFILPEPLSSLQMSQTPLPEIVTEPAPLPIAEPTLPEVVTEPMLLPIAELTPPVIVVGAVIIDSEDDFQEPQKAKKAKKSVGKKIKILQNVIVKPKKVKRTPKGKLAGAIDDAPYVSKPTRPSLVVPKSKSKATVTKPYTAMKNLNSLSVACMNYAEMLARDQVAKNFSDGAYKLAKEEFDEAERETVIESASLQREQDGLMKEDAQIQQQIEVLQGRQISVRNRLKDLGIQIARVKESHPTYSKRLRALDMLERHRREKSERLRARMALCEEVAETIFAIIPNDNK